MIKLHCLAVGRRTTFGLSYREVLKIEGLKNLDSTADITVLSSRCAKILSHSNRLTHSVSYFKSFRCNYL